MKRIARRIGLNKFHALQSSDTAILNILSLGPDENNLIYFLLNPCPKK
jgi:hypothetical protein